MCCGKVASVTVFDLPLDQLRRRNTIKWTRFEPDVLPMFVAEMDCHMAPPIAERLHRAVAESDTGYPEKPFYQEAFADFARWMWGWQLEAGSLSLAGDVMAGIRELVLVATRPGDAVVINTPVYPPIRATCRMTGREVLDVPIGDDHRLDLAGLAAAFSGQRGPRPTAYLLCSPHNPHGVAHTREELAEVARLAAEHDVVVISDEIHAPLAGADHVPFTTLPGAERSFVVTSASKSWNLAGLKAGLIVPGPDAGPTMRSLPSIVAEAASWFGILAHSTALSQGRNWLTEVSTEIEENQQWLAGLLSRELGLEHTPAQATYLAWVDCSPLGLENPGKHFHDVGRVRFNPGTDFSPTATQFVRINVGTSREIIAEGVHRMRNSL